MHKENHANALTAAEALVLQNPQAAQSRAALKLTLMELLARRVVTMRHEERKGMFGRTQRTDYLQLAPDAEKRSPGAPHITAVVEMLRAAGASGNGATMPTVVSQARRAFGNDLAGFQNKHVLPGLISGGLVEAYQAKRFGLFTTTRYRHTSQGAMVQQELGTHLEQAHSLPEVIDRDPVQAAALIATLGSSVLLVDELKPHYARLSQALRQPQVGDDSDFSNSDVGDDNSIDTDDSSFESADFDLGDFGGFDFDFDAFDALDSSLDAFDSSFDSSSDSSSDGGSDSGGSSD